MIEDVLTGRKEIARYLGEPERRIRGLVKQGLKAWKTSKRGTWKCFKADCNDFLMAQRDHYSKCCQEDKL